MLRIHLAALAALAFLFAVPQEVSAIERHPSLVTTPAGVERARVRVREEQWARDLLKSLTDEAEAFSNVALPVFETEWWKESSKKHWTQTYPEINYHTGSAVSGPVVKAYHAAMAYAATGESKYAELVRKVLLHYTNYEFFAEHPDVGLNWSVWCTRALYAYDLVYDTFAAGDRPKIDDFFRRAMEAVRKDDQWWVRENPGGMFNNHFAWHKHFIGAYGLFFGKPELVDYAINEDQGIRELIEHGIRDDGLWLEGSINYHFTTLPAMTEFARNLRNSGNALDLWNHGFANGRCLRDLFRGPIGVLFPDETIPQIGDTYGRRMRLGDVKLYFDGYDAYRDPHMAWVLRDAAPSPEALFLESLPGKPYHAPRPKTRNWPEHGYVMLRTQEGSDYWGGDGYAAFLSYDLNGIHSHNDKMDLIVYGRRAHLAVDPEAIASAKHAFSAQIQGELNRSTVCHNTLMVDRKEQAGVATKLELVDLINGPDVKLATVADTRGLVYPGVRLMRTVAATPDYVLDVFQAASDEEHAYSYLFHTPSDGAETDEESGFGPVDLGNAPPWKWLRNARSRAAADGDWVVSSRQGDLRVVLRGLGAPRTELILCDFPTTDTFDTPPVKMLMAERKAKSTVFVTLLQAKRDTLDSANISLAEDRHGFLRVTVGHRGKVREFSVRKLAAQ